MADIRVNQILSLPPGILAFDGLVRVIWQRPELDRVWLIPIDQRKPKCPAYASVVSLLAAIERGEVTAPVFKSDPRSLISDEQLADAYPPRNGQDQSFPIAYRERWWTVIEPIVAESWRYFSGLCSLRSLVFPRSKALAVPYSAVFHALYRYWGGGAIKAALLPYSYRCGGKGNKRAGTGRRLGRRTIKARMGDGANTNFPLEAKQIEVIQYVWRTHLGPLATVRQAYEIMLRNHFVSHWEERNGVPEPVLVPKGKYPTLTQFRYHGPRQDQGKEAWKRDLTALELNLNHRRLAGPRPNGLFRIGAVGQTDGSTSDLPLRSLLDRTKIVGTCHVQWMIDEATHLIVGMHVGWSMDDEAMKLTILNAASSKVEYCARYGITVSDDDFPRVIFAKLVGDRGEMHSEGIRQAVAKLNGSIEILQTGRGDLKGAIEGTHHKMHRAVAHRTEGTTHGRPRKRGEREAALDSSLNIHEFTALLIKAVIYVNTREPVEDLLTPEMIQDGVAPTRIAIWRWAKQKGYVAYVDCDEDRLVTALCPECDAIVRSDGVHLFHQSEASGGYPTTVNWLRYDGLIAQQEMWLERARNRGSFRIRVLHNPYDLRKIWFVHGSLGLQELQLISDDPYLRQLLTLREIVLSQTDVRLNSLADVKDQALEARVVLTNDHQVTVENAKREKIDAMSALEKPPSKTRQLADRRANRADEIAHTGKSPIPKKVSRDVQTDRVAEVPNAVTPITAAKKSVSDDIERRAIEAWLEEGETK